ncbi:RimJ/RimL family protein N-acetyltransferase [Kribbella voronezhensis]|uniref:RimJ/RimL family protein N-acetyltransferase n=1 Tax=Kribbella voronezhensis TaxID=2512212 RepID=A0A4R7SZ23_9ACTN|nr:GNAT family N-acetyltransferase [Kribbella voronezhensis]TDU84169.1 RimJ/RimL family protein N-acetyltransferase [Kribbella voronezhensis]
MRTTDRLLLRPYRDEDRPAFAAMNADPEVMKYLGGEPLTREQSDEITAGANQRYVAESIGFLAVERRSDGAFLGACGLMRPDEWFPGEIEVGWRLAREYWGHGYATEAAISWLDHAFRERSDPRVIAVADTPNLNSIAVMKRLGMTFDHETELVEDGVPFDATIYSITREAWLSRER